MTVDPDTKMLATNGGHISASKFRGINTQLRNISSKLYQAVAEEEVRLLLDAMADITDAYKLFRNGRSVLERTATAAEFNNTLKDYLPENVFMAIGVSSSIFYSRENLVLVTNNAEDLEELLTNQIPGFQIKTGKKMGAQGVEIKYNGKDYFKPQDQQIFYLEIQ